MPFRTGSRATENLNPRNRQNGGFFRVCRLFRGSDLGASEGVGPSRKLGQSALSEQVDAMTMALRIWVDEVFVAHKVNAINFMPTTRDEARMREDAERLADIFTALQRSFILRLSKELARGNVSFPQYCLLGFLVQQKQLSMSEIAQRMGHTTAAATGLVDRLEKLEHVKRIHGRDDRRKILVQPTASGADLVAEVRDDMVGNLLKMMTRLDSDEQKTWVRIYEKIFSYCQNQ